MTAVRISSMAMIAETFTHLGAGGGPSWCACGLFGSAIYLTCNASVGLRFLLDAMRPR